MLPGKPGVRTTALRSFGLILGEPFNENRSGRRVSFRTAVEVPNYCQSQAINSSGERRLSQKSMAAETGHQNSTAWRRRTPKRPDRLHSLQALDVACHSMVRDSLGRVLLYQVNPILVPGSYTAEYGDHLFGDSFP